MRMKHRLGINPLIGVCQENLGYNKSAFKAVTNFFTGSEEKKAAKKAERLEKQKTEALQRQQEVQATRERLKTLRESRIRRAQIISQGAGAGIGMASSPVQGGLASLQSQTATNVAQINTAQTGAQVIGNLDTQINSALNQQRAAERSSQRVGNIFSLATSGYSVYNTR